MGPINDNTNITAGYFHHVDDTSKTATARRATYNPSPNNKITNKFARMDMPRMAGMVNAVRDFDLSIRQSWNRNRLNSARNKVDDLRAKGETGDKMQRLQESVGRREHKDMRLVDKRSIGKAAVQKALNDETEMAQENLQAHLRSLDYQPLEGLRDVEHERVTSRYLSSVDDGHRIKIHSDGPPRLAAMVANQVSADHDRGASGISRRARSTMQHALVGIKGASLSLTGGVTGVMAGSRMLDQGSRARMDVRSARARQERDMLKGALGGNEALNASYRQTVEQQIADAARRQAASEGQNGQDLPTYVVRASQDGIKPPQTRFWDRKVNQFYSPRPLAPATGEAATDAASDASSIHSFDEKEAEEQQTVQRKPGRLARFALGVSNLRNKRALQRAGAEVAMANAKLAGFPDSEKKEAYEAAWQRSHTALDKASHAYATRRSAFQGKLIETLQQAEVRDYQQTSFPEQTHLSGNLPWPRRPGDERDDP
ncbi:hypothetical protein J8I26_04175 [Herbaspirillum sp. LeCh32-8]|uniref:hypothetical protein n=1 Tax=Herbaspirillum sp. LeCh32-8 TaxID=2821356 RepID=UPI001AE9BE6B|nr:hypothetical protein [Herbaspirillum sp. LeCh32-8]MBP0597287.1 hypothetical protein [Herbaspirillum sp. LeCh32-8]